MRDHGGCGHSPNAHLSVCFRCWADEADAVSWFVVLVIKTVDMFTSVSDAVSFLRCWKRSLQQMDHDINYRSQIPHALNFLLLICCKQPLQAIFLGSSGAAAALTRLVEAAIRPAAESASTEPRFCHGVVEQARLCLRKA